MEPKRLELIHASSTKATIRAVFSMPTEPTTTTTTEPTTTTTDADSWQTWHSMKAPPSGEFRTWMHWAVTRFECLWRAPQPLDYADINKWRPLFVKWARTASPTVRELCIFLVQFSHVNGAFSQLRSSSYNLHHALVNMDKGNRRGMCEVIMHARVY